MIDLLNYDQLKSDGFEYYNNIKRIDSPIFNQSITFNAEGFNHIIFKNARTERERSSQIARFNLLPLAVKLLKIATTYQEFEESIEKLEVKEYKKKVRKTKIVKYWGVIAIIDNRKIKVIIRKIGDNGNFHFWSIVPDWVTNKHRDIRFISTMKGCPEED